MCPICRWRRFYDNLPPWYSPAAQTPLECWLETAKHRWLVYWCTVWSASYSAHQLQTHRQLQPADKGCWCSDSTTEDTPEPEIFHALQNSPLFPSPPYYLCPSPHAATQPHSPHLDRLAVKELAAWRNCLCAFIIILASWQATYIPISVRRITFILYILCTHPNTCFDKIAK